MKKQKTSVSRKIFLACNYTLLVLVCLSCVLPFVHLFAISLSGRPAVAAGKVTFWPVEFTLSSYEYAFKKGDFMRALGNSLVRTFLGTIINLILMVLTAYPLSKGKSRLMVDGASEFQLLYKVVLPLLKPSLATVGLFCIVGHWNDWFSGIIYLNDRAMYPLATYMQSLLRSFESLMRQAGADYRQLASQINVRTGRAAQLFLGALPVMVVYPFLQKYFTSGLTLGSVKG